MERDPSDSNDRDVCRARYDRLLFAKERCGDLNKDRGRMLELGAMSVLEAAIENVSLDAEHRQTISEQRYRSCLETLLEGHYQNLCELIWCWRCYIHVHIIHAMHHRECMTGPFADTAAMICRRVFRSHTTAAAATRVGSLIASTCVVILQRGMYRVCEPAFHLDPQHPSPGSIYSSTYDMAVP